MSLAPSSPALSSIFVESGLFPPAKATGVLLCQRMSLIIPAAEGSSCARAPFASLCSVTPFITFTHLFL